MINSTMRLAIIIGSVREGRFGATVANWFARHAEARGEFEIDVIDLAKFTFPNDMNRDASTEDFS